MVSVNNTISHWQTALCTSQTWCISVMNFLPTHKLLWIDLPSMKWNWLTLISCNTMSCLSMLEGIHNVSYHGRHALYTSRWSVISKPIGHFTYWLSIVKHYWVELGEWIKQCSPTSKLIYHFLTISKILLRTLYCSLEKAWATDTQTLIINKPVKIQEQKCDMITKGIHTVQTIEVCRKKLYCSTVAYKFTIHLGIPSL